MKSSVLTLFFCTLSGIVCAQNLDKLHKQAERGNIKAISELVDYYMLNYDRERAVYYMEKGEALGEKAVHHGLRAGCYYYEEGRTKDRAEAVRWAKSANIDEDPFGMLLLGLMYLFGDGLDQNVINGVRLIKRSAHLGSPVAAEVLKDIARQSEEQED